MIIFCNDDENDDEGRWTNFDKKNSHKPSARVSLNWAMLGDEAPVKYAFVVLTIIAKLRGACCLQKPRHEPYML